MVIPIYQFHYYQTTMSKYGHKQNFSIYKQRQLIKNSFINQHNFFIMFIIVKAIYKICRNIFSLNVSISLNNI